DRAARRSRAARTGATVRASPARGAADPPPPLSRRRCARRRRPGRACRPARATPPRAGVGALLPLAPAGPGRRELARARSPTPAAIVPAAALAAAQVASAGLPPAPRAAFPPPDRPEVLPAALRPPTSRYEVKAGTIIPAVLVTGVNSDLPGQMIAQVRENVFDTESGQYLLVPQGARLIGFYDHQVAYGQERVLVTWKRVIFPNGSSLSLKD